MSALIKRQNRLHFYSILSCLNPMEQGSNMAVITQVIRTSSIHRNYTNWHDLYIFIRNICDFHIFYFHITGNSDKRGYLSLKAIFF